MSRSRERSRLGRKPDSHHDLLLQGRSSASLGRWPLTGVIDDTDGQGRGLQKHLLDMARSHVLAASTREQRSVNLNSDSAQGHHDD